MGKRHGRNSDRYPSKSLLFYYLDPPPCDMRPPPQSSGYGGRGGGDFGSGCEPVEGGGYGCGLPTL
uniref:Uncharacterized protein n=1 Tax=Medicago truncatula TaxID=3880 RepID=A2Q290_MEDTR|nr:hypothetical protein MtrDRAFT_AC149576g17v2 [Medicago truncatula]